jgi:hypothetical protein
MSGYPGIKLALNVKNKTYFEVMNELCEVDTKCLWYTALLLQGNLEMLEWIELRFGIMNFNGSYGRTEAEFMKLICRYEDEKTTEYLFDKLMSKFKEKEQIYWRAFSLQNTAIEMGNLHILVLMDKYNLLVQEGKNMGVYKSIRSYDCYEYLIEKGYINKGDTVHLFVNLRHYIKNNWGQYIKNTNYWTGVDLMRQIIRTRIFWRRIFFEAFVDNFEATLAKYPFGSFILDDVKRIVMIEYEGLQTCLKKCDMLKLPQDIKEYVLKPFI